MVERGATASRPRHTPAHMVPRPRRSASLTALGVTVVLGAHHVWWWYERRQGMPRFIDESGYLAIAIDHTNALGSDGLSGLVDVFRSQAVIAPLVPMLTVPAQLVMSDDVTAGYVTMVGFFALLGFATHALTRRLAPAWWATAAVVVVLCSPQVVMLTRMYYFAVPSAALLTLALVCFLRSDGLTSPRWAVAGAVLLGCTVLTRTMMLALAPGVLLAVGVQMIARHGLRRRQVALAVASAVAAAAVAAIWYANSIDLVLDYLSGRDLREDGPRRSLLGQLGQVTDVLQGPLTGVLSLGLVLRLVGRTRGARAGARERMRRWLASDEGAVIVLVLWITLVLYLADEAMGQWVPLLPALVAVVMGRLAELRWPVVRRCVAWGLVAVSTVHIAASSGLAPRLGEPRTVVAGPLGRMQITDGREFIQIDLASQGLEVGPAGRLPRRYSAWEPFALDLTAFLSDYASVRAQPAVVAFIGRRIDPLFGPWDVLLAARRLGDASVHTAFQPTSGQRASVVVSEIDAQLNDPARGTPTVVLTFEYLGAIEPTDADLRRTRALARALEYHGYRSVLPLVLPDGRRGAVWWRARE